MYTFHLLLKDWFGSKFVQLNMVMNDAQLENGETSDHSDPFGTNFVGLLTDGCNQEQARRPFCERCKKMKALCICNRFKGMVENKTRVTILQHPLERDHPVGSARVAVLGLRNVSLITVLELDKSVVCSASPQLQRNPGVEAHAHEDAGFSLLRRAACASSY